MNLNEKIDLGICFVKRVLFQTLSTCECASLDFGSRYWVAWVFVSILPSSFIFSCTVFAVLRFPFFLGVVRPHGHQVNSQPDQVLHPQLPLVIFAFARPCCFPAQFFFLAPRPGAHCQSLICSPRSTARSGLRVFAETGPARGLPHSRARAQCDLVATRVLGLPRFSTVLGSWQIVFYFVILLLASCRFQGHSPRYWGLSTEFVSPAEYAGSWCRSQLPLDFGCVVDKFDFSDCWFLQMKLVLFLSYHIKSWVFLLLTVSLYGGLLVTSIRSSLKCMRGCEKSYWSVLVAEVLFVLFACAESCLSLWF
jgi:hypothetical protein